MWTLSSNMGGNCIWVSLSQYIAAFYRWKGILISCYCCVGKGIAYTI